LDFTWWGAGPFATKYLADFGATVVKVESRKKPDLLRLSEPYKDGRVDFNTSAMFLHANTSKLSLTLNLGHPQGLELAKRLVAWADVVVENFSAGTMKRLGLGYEVLREIKPDIIMVSSSCLGQQGAYTDLRGHALVGAALTGHFHLTGYPDGEPATPGSIGYADVVQPLFTVVSILAALEYRRRTGRGQYIDITQIEPMTNFIAPAVLDFAVNRRPWHRMANRHPQAAPHGAFRCRGEDRWCTIAVFTEEEWQGLCRAMGHPDWTKEPRFATLKGRKENEDELEMLVESWTVNYSPEEVVALLQKEGVPSGVVHTAADLVDGDPHLEERGSFIFLEHPIIGKCRHPAPPIKLSESPSRVATSPLLGEHTEYICTQILGLSEEEFARLVAEGVFD